MDFQIRFQCFKITQRFRYAGVFIQFLVITLLSIKYLFTIQNLYSQQPVNQFVLNRVIIIENQGWIFLNFQLIVNGSISPFLTVELQISYYKRIQIAMLIIQQGLFEYLITKSQIGNFQGEFEKRHIKNQAEITVSVSATLKFQFKKLKNDLIIHIYP
ncbi:unnamed protein product (macronuclear) [Paramecium tetraurelia]|uniref:Transmembrane protein n=1 Tax=Paramecium tetraurelia TaxID=5888 RepID=A0DKT7_PARTE|nr:uncharacterized protein GSPATT00039553001 [Paramecium tetraurelia]CAK83654.1 unnamed protein product [Paramecium tetraurelia]|eukprot:XP_001451051.1 hypothetical protein (macronuclear) [Paramecium tetraurelia strain d4-2]